MQTAAFVAPLPAARRVAALPRVSRARAAGRYSVRMTGQPPREDGLQAAEQGGPDAGYELDPDAIKERAMAVVSDVGSRPLFYGKIVGYAVGAIVTVTVLRAVVIAVDSIPVLPAALELVGLGYTAWFVWRYVLFKESREELLEEIEDFLGRARPGQ